jgi:hypothetical protein
MIVLLQVSELHRDALTSRQKHHKFLTDRFDLDGVAHSALQWEFVSLSHRVGFARHYYAPVTTLTEREEGM